MIERMYYYMIIFIIYLNFIKADEIFNEWNDVGISILKRMEESTIKLQRLEKLERMVGDLQFQLKELKELKVEVNDLKEYKENSKRKLYSLEETNQILIEHVNKCNENIEEIKRSSSINNSNNNNIQSTDAVGAPRRLLSTTNNNNNGQHSGITMNDGTSIRFIQNNNANSVSLSHENGVLKVNGTLQLNDDILDVTTTTKTIHVPSDYATITAAIASLKSVHYNSVVIQLAPGTYDESVTIAREMVIPKGLIIRGDSGALGSYIFNSSTSGFAISVTKAVDKLLIDGITIVGSGNGIYVENAHVEIGNLNISTSGQYGILCTGSQSYLRILDDSIVHIENPVQTEFMAIKVSDLARTYIGGTVLLDGPGITGGASGISIQHGATVSFGIGHIFIRNFRSGVDMRWGSSLHQNTESTLLDISECKFGFEVYYGNNLFLTNGNTKVNVSNIGTSAFNIYGGMASIDHTSISTPEAGTAGYAIFARYNAYVYLGGSNSISTSNWNTNTLDVSYGSVVFCSSSCPTQGTTTVDAKVSILGIYRRYGDVYCASEDNSCNAISGS